MPNETLSPKDLIEIISEEFKLGTQKEVADFLNLTSGRISQIKSSSKITKANIKSILHAVHKAGQHSTKKEIRSEINKKILDSYKELHSLTTHKDIANSLETTRENVAQWSSGNTQITQQTIQKILKQAVPIRITTLLEMEKVDPLKPNKKWYFFGDSSNKKREKIINQIKNKRGVYFYFDSTGRLTYAGKADKTPLDKEVEGRLSQQTKSGRILYGEKMKKKVVLDQGEIARYISAYEVSPRELIPLVEALIIRITANSQYNKKLESVSK
jgi:transcriptional regulator with XRE-family HTH domain